MQSLDAFAKAALGRLETRALRRRMVSTERRPGAAVVREGEVLVSFSCNDYLGLSQDPRVKAAAAEAVLRYGAGAGASRLVTGDHPLIQTLEARLAAHKGAPAALVFGSGYLVNLSVPPALVGEGDVIYLDELSHACMLAGAKLSGARAVRFRHNDLDHLRSLLADSPAGGRRLIMSERVFSMDGDQAPGAGLLALALAHDAWLMMDDAHGLGVLAPGEPAPLEMGTLSKALGSYGGYLAASEAVIELLKSRARGLVYSTGLPPAAVGAALKALEILEAEPERAVRPLELASRFAKAAGLPAAQSAIVPLVTGDADLALRFSALLREEGFLVAAIRPPTVPEGGSRLRFTFSAAHAEEDVDRLGEVTARLKARLL